MKKQLFTLFAGTMLCLLAACATGHRHTSSQYAPDGKEPSLFQKMFGGHDNNQVPIEELIRYIIVKTGATPLCDMEPGPVHAERGFSVMLAGRQVAFYKYNLDRKKMRKKHEYIKDNGFVYIVGRKYTAEVNGSFVMIDHDKNAQKDLLLKVFREF
ncbi:MAG: hypothetical protein IKB22_07655 [Lentisphaeria bacterium]|nr:hypothetical protein [Lentisphaeria bacterium]